METIDSKVPDIVRKLKEEKFIKNWDMQEKVEESMQQSNIALFENDTLISRGDHDYTLIQNRDIIGAKISNDENSNWEVEISTMPKTNPNTGLRELLCHYFNTESESNAIDFASTFINVANGVQIKENEYFADIPAKTRKILVFINPVSGQKLASDNWTQLRPLLERFHVEIDDRITAYAGHAREICQIENMEAYEGVVSVGGDGLAHEIVNGLMNRADKLKQLPFLGFLPGGSSDGMLKTVLHECGEALSPVNSVYIIGKGKSKKIDLVQYESTLQSEPIYSFLSLTWAIIADVDLESEVIRSFGTLRFYLWTVWRLIKLRSYNVKLVLKNDIEEQEETIEKGMYFLTFHNTPFIHRDMHVLPICSMQDGFNHVLMMDDTKSRFSLANMLLNFDDGSCFKKIEHEDSNGQDTQGDLLKQYTPNFDKIAFDYKRVTEYEIIPDQEFLDLCRDPNSNVNYGKFSIDGEEYPVDSYKGKVLSKIFDVYSC